MRKVLQLQKVVTGARTLYPSLSSGFVSGGANFPRVAHVSRRHSKSCVHLQRLLPSSSLHFLCRDVSTTTFSPPVFFSTFPSSPSSFSSVAPSALSASAAVPSSSLASDQSFVSNVSADLLAKIGRNLHRQLHHPINTIKNIIFNRITSRNVGKDGHTLFKTFDNLNPQVTTNQNFDELLVPKDHVCRSPIDTFYIDENTVLRTHTSAHQTELMRQGNSAFLACGDCFRRDEIDATHYPVFHQMEGVRIFSKEEIARSPEGRVKVMEDLKLQLEDLVKCLFGNVEMRWVDAYFPFTDPSLELEIFFNGKWLEVLGCGAIQESILDSAGYKGHVGWAFGLGLERLAMVLFDIPDIRLFWTKDQRFLSQFIDGEIKKFQPFSKYPPCPKDISFWMDTAHFQDNDFFAIVRTTAGDNVENVALVDEFTHPKTQRLSKCFRIMYRSLERSLTNDEVNEWQFNVRKALSRAKGVELR